MNEIIEQAKLYLRGMWQYRWYIHAVAWLVCAGGWYVVATIPDEYTSSARVYVDTRSVLRPLLKGLTVQSDINKDVAIITRMLLSRPILEKVVAMTDLDLHATTPEARESLYTRLTKKIEIKGGRKTNLYSITYKDSNALRAKIVVEALINILVETSLGDVRKDADSAQKFIGDQIYDYELRLLDAENRVKEFKIKNIGLMPSDGKGYYSRLISARAGLRNVKLELEVLENRRDELKRQMSGEEPSFGIMTGGTSTATHPVDARIFKLRENLDDLLQRYTEQHPDVISTRRRLESLEQTRAADLAASPIQDNTLEKNPVYQQLKIALGSTEAEIVALSVRVKHQQADVDKLASLVDTIPEVEAEMARLNRDYDITKANYEALLRRRESAQLSEDADKSGDDIRFRIVDPPFMPQKPNYPNRPFFDLVVLLGGLAAGLAFSFFLSQLRPTIDNERQGRLVTGLPVLGSVSRVLTVSERRRRQAELVSFGMVGMGLILVFVLLVSSVIDLRVIIGVA